MIDISFTAAARPEDGNGLSAVLLCHGAEFAQGAVFRQHDEALGGALSRAVSLRDFSGKAGQTLSLTAPSAAVAQFHLLGCAPADDEPQSAGTAARSAGGEAVKLLKASGVEAQDAALLLEAGQAPLAAEIALGAQLGSYRFDRYRTVSSRTPALQALHVVLPDAGQLAEARAGWKELEGLGRSVFLTRDLVNEPANVLFPEEFAQRIKELESLGLEVEVLDRARMEELGFGALLGVAQGSEKPPFTVIMRHRGVAGTDSAPLAFIGKGVTFDSGGISIKPAAGMDEMKMDMGGAAAVVGVMSALARRKAPVNAVGVVGLVENMVSGAAQRPGDIVKSHSGQTIEVLNTDAEGRLVLADLLSYTRQTFEPALMVNLATLTGAIVVALGSDHAGLFSNDDQLASALAQAGEESGETLWRMPMGASYNRRIDSDIADMKNIGGRPGSSILAAEFLKRFVGDTPWAHLDIAGTAWAEQASAITPKGASGFGVRLLDRFVRLHQERTSRH
ncbi:leucyl aminopeptidase [Parasaccharibacter sp. TMW 2.1884]|uniref:leucyl aminopeptidase n=1 Tax=Parasaccharibacter sp. TMW 2.1884 TaxID=2267834 RepID=UPI002012955F|nr:leucyl aminopeptidase [Parasaccharibacter sp. TMW 2.1884]MCL1512341.1 leucyl aminopeptidase [Parasaccharibacter sp. TMW 2.1884]